MRTVSNRAASVHGDILVLECAIEELPLLAENLEVDMTAANQQYRERLLLQKVKEQQAGYQERRCGSAMFDCGKQETDRRSAKRHRHLLPSAVACDEERHRTSTEIWPFSFIRRVGVAHDIDDDQSMWSTTLLRRHAGDESARMGDSAAAM